jgi:N-formylglutamate amidohydrolase
MKPMKHRCRLIGENGNIFNLMGIVSKTLKEAGESEKAEEMIQRITTEAKSYDEALAMLMEYVDVE